jgi:hypothetical protein
MDVTQPQRQLALPAAPATTIGRYWFLASVLLIMLAAIGLRAPSVTWLQEVTPETNFTFHPDERRFIEWADEFESKPRMTYVAGMATHLYVVKEFARLVLNSTVDLVVTLRTVSLAYSVMLIGLMAYLARSLTASPQLALLTAAFLTVAPAHMISSHFGTPDGAVTFYFILASWLGWHFAKTGAQPSFIGGAAAIGIAMAIKFPIPLLMLFGAMVLLSERKLHDALVGGLVAAFAFLAANFFSFTPWDFARFLRALLVDVAVTGYEHPNTVVYSIRAIPTGLGLGGAFCLAIGLIAVSCEVASRLRTIRVVPNRVQLRAWATHPLAAFALPFAVYLYLMIGIDIANLRYLLPLLPLLCLGAAFGLMVLLRMLRLGPIPAAVAVIALFSYQMYNAVGVAQIYQNDVRYEAARWLDANLASDAAALTFLPYSQVKGVQLIGDVAELDAKVDTQYIVTSDLEYARYLSSASAGQVYHAYGGQKRLEFFHDLFAGRVPYKIVARFQPQPLTVEQELIKREWMGPLDTFTPGDYIIFAKTDTSK